MSGPQVVNYEPAGPVIRRFMQSDAFVRILVGPLGSGKTTAAVIEILRRAALQAPGPDGVRRSRWAIVRNTFSDLKTTTIKSWSQWCPPQFGKLTMGTSPIVHSIMAAGLDLEVFFLPLDSEDDVRKLLSLELTGLWIDEAREIPKAILDAATGRVGRYPGKLQGGCTWSGVIATSNPSDTESWLYKLAANPPEGYEVFRQPGGLTAEAENLANLPPNCYQRIAVGKDAEWLKVYVGGEFGFLVEGKPVYPNWRDSVHVAPEPIQPVPTMGLAIGADFGLTPCAIIGQALPDGRIVILDELVTEDTGIVRFADLLTRYMAQHYPGFDVVGAWGDPAGTARGGHDERTVFDILNERTPWRWRPAPTNEVTLRIESVSHALGRMVDGRPGFLLSPTCATLRKGFCGGYHFKQVRSGNGATFHEVPAKNAFSHPHDALQYLVLGMGGAVAVLNKAARSQRRSGGHRAIGVDYDTLNPGDASVQPERGPLCGNGRPAHLRQREARTIRD